MIKTGKSPLFHRFSPKECGVSKSTGPGDTGTFANSGLATGIRSRQPLPVPRCSDVRTVGPGPPPWSDTQHNLLSSQTQSSGRPGWMGQFPVLQKSLEIQGRWLATDFAKICGHCLGPGTDRGRRSRASGLPCSETSLQSLNHAGVHTSVPGSYRNLK